MTFELLDSIHRIDRHQWNQLWQQAGGDAGLSPFLRHEFLAALEDSGCTNEKSGWVPRHLIVKSATGELRGAMPLYEKHHSYGEYVFDWGWADAYQRNGLNYYPKLLAAIPFTPATGPRLALVDESDRSVTVAALHRFLNDYCRSEGLSSWHCLFLPAGETELWQQAGSQSRIGCQFHWVNRSYDTFEQFLESFNSRKRKAVRKERSQVTAQGVTLQRLTGSAITAADWDRFYRFYHTTYLKRSGSGGYLNRDFFAAIGESLADQLLMVNGQRNGNTIASALCFFDQQRLYGRYWGCREEVSGLHFEACYYQGIEFAIERGLQVFDPGAQGEHKIQRGFEPTITWSQHWLADPRFMEAVEDFLRRETPAVEAYRDDCASYLPFRQEG